MAESGGKMRTFIMLISFLGIFFVMSNSMPPQYVPIVSEYAEHEYETYFDPATLQSYNFSDSEWGVYTFDTEWPVYTNSTGAIDLGGFTARISSCTYYGVEWLLVEHKQGVWPWGWHLMEAPQGYSGLGYDIASDFWDEDSQISSFGVRCDHTEFTVLITYNTTQFDSLEDAYNGRYVYMTVGVGYQESLVSGGSVWTLVSQLLTFQAPDVHYLINFALVFPIYSAILILVFMLVAEIIPG